MVQNKDLPVSKRDPPAVLAGKRSSALQTAELETTAPKKRGRGRPALHKVEQQAPIIPVEEPDTLSDINEKLPTIYLVKKR